jgi:hypothetical protein
MDNRAESRPAVTWLVVVMLLAAMALYLLSSGPAVLLRDRGVLTQTTFLKLYMPLFWFYDTVPFFRNAWEWYLGFWAQPPPS